MRVQKKVILDFKGKRAEAQALFDAGAGFTIMSAKKFERFFNSREWHELDEPYYGYLINREKVKLDRYVILKIIINTHILVEMIFLTDDFVEEIKVGDKIIKMPDIIIGSGTMDKYGIELSAEKGLVFRGILIL